MRKTNYQQEKNQQVEHYFAGFMQKRPNSSVLAMELHLFFIKPSICLSHLGIIFYLNLSEN